MTQEHDYDTEPAHHAYWFCEECGHADYKRALPPDRAAFYANQAARIARTGDGGYKCPKCKSMALMPKGF